VRGRGRSLLAGSIALAGLAANAYANEPVQFVVEYAAPAECGDEGGFVSRISGRTRRARLGAGPGATALDVHVERQADQLAGRIRIVSPDGDERVRNLRAEGCEEVVDALALIAALALDPEASDQLRPEPERAEPPALEAPPTVVVPSRPTALDWSFGVGARVVALDSVLPGTEPGFGLWIDAASAGQTLAPSLRLLLRRTTGSARGGDGSAQLVLTTGVMSVCPLRVPERGPIAGRACAGLAIGLLSAEGRGVDLPRRPTRLWFAPELGGRIEWRFAGPLELALDAGAQLPLRRPAYSFESGERVFEVPQLGFSLGLELGLRFE
jgi:hypothetical protein